MRAPPGDGAGGRFLRLVGVLVRRAFAFWGKSLGEGGEGAADLGAVAGEGLDDGGGEADGEGGGGLFGVEGGAAGAGAGSAAFGGAGGWVRHGGLLRWCRGG